MRKKKEEPITIDPNEPFGRCFDCKYWHMIENGDESVQFDLSSGRCDHNGYTKCPPMFRCKGWSFGKNN